MPDTPEGYDFSLPDGLPDELKPDETATTAFRTAMHEAGVPPNYAKAAADFYWNYMKSLHEKVEADGTERQKATEAALRKQWAGDYDTKVEQAKRGLQHYGSDGQKLQQYLDDTGLGNEPVIANILADIGRYTSEDPMVGGVSPEQARSIEEQRSAIRNDPDYMNSSSPRFAELHDKMRDLTSRLPGSGGPIVGREGRTV